VQELLYTHSVNYRGGMGIAPCRIAATTFETGHIDCVFNSEAQSIERTAIGRGQIESRYKGVTLNNGNRGAVHSRTSTQREQSAVTLQPITICQSSDKKNDC
jgi:hypothetical protein